MAAERRCSLWSNSQPHFLLTPVFQTIIECLKYATTGEQPPNTRGGAFIHDPVLANEKEVKAQVKLRFNAANGTRMLAVRNLQVSRKKAGGLTMKTLENILSLADAPEGNKVCI